MTKCSDLKKPCPGPKPELFSLYPLCFDEAVDMLLEAKPKRCATTEKPAKEKAKRQTQDKNRTLSEKPNSTA